MTTRRKQLGYAILVAGVFAACWLFTTRTGRKPHANTIPREELILNLETTLASVGDFRGTVELAGNVGSEPCDIVYDVVSKGENLMYVHGNINGETTSSFVSKGKTTWLLPKPGGKLDRMANFGSAVTLHPSMQSFLSGALYGLKRREFDYSARRTDVGRIHVTIKATHPESEWVYELDPKTFYVIKQHSRGPQGTVDAIWTAIDVKTTIPEDFFDRKLEELKKMAGHDNGGREDAQPPAAAAP
jgi:outer membrane lipoprotein-sorting protein